ncbi:ABC transporter ATP-binding protein [Oceanicella actignis]|uniref:ABC transporter ATP-binding protein n=1 Tax=Oceanicella actignis TaxID=1189325 RepID=UPI0011E84CD0|nr:dipeptide ABC transporter ATP-binding protein [Oceanicella actignis]TYO88896.1 peptide/nickel transport system ATP-binding protein [Oceanicella actignis]
MSLLRIDRLSLRIGAAQVLRDVSLHIAPGEVLGVVGESGSGKSMTALSVMRLAPRGVAEGRVLFEGEDLLAASEARMCALRGAAIGMVFQEPMTALNPLHPIGRQVEEVIRLHRPDLDARAEARRALERAGLPADRVPHDRYPHDLSGGQRQRVVIAMATALRPRLVIADEPTTALDVTTQARILDLLRRLTAEDGAGLMLITHDLAVVAEMADRIAIMKDGEVVETDETVRLFRNMRHPYTRALFQASVHQPARRARPPGDEVLRAREVTREHVSRRGLLRRRTAFRAVDRVSLAIRQGENVGLVGESGCGKSTLARALLALEPLQGGAVTLCGAPFAPGAPPERRRHVQAVFQDPYDSFDPRWTVARLVAEPLHMLRPRPSRAEARRRAAAALARVGLGDEALDRYPHEFSGGQRQRIAIARALVCEPRLVVLDEAVSALDVSVRARILDLLAELSDRLDLSMLFISHDLHVVRAVTDRVAVMQAGRIVEEGPTERIFSAPRHPCTRALLEATPDLERALAARAARAPHEKEPAR